MSEQPRPIILSVHRCGSPDFERFVISDQFLRYYTGSDWSLDAKQALLYVDVPSAATTIHNLLLVEYHSKSVRRFRAPVEIERYGADELSINDLQRWLAKVTRLVMDSPKFGNGPLQGSLGLATIRWGELKEVPQ